MPGASTGMILRATAGHPARGRFFLGVAAGLLARRSASYPVFPMRGRISDVKSGTTHCLQLRGQRRILARSRDTPASLLATKSCDMAGRDGYIWYYSNPSVNGAREIDARNFPKKFPQRDGKHGKPILAPRESRFSPTSWPRQIMTWHRARIGIASRRFEGPGRPVETRAADNPAVRTPCSPCRSASPVTDRS
jgi:hypothetical protein